MDNLLTSSLANMNMLMHPPGMLLNACRVEQTQGDFTFYDQGMSPAVGALVSALDRERCALCEALGVVYETFMDTFYAWNYTTEEAYRTGSAYEAIKNSLPNKLIKAEPTMTGRYVSEDVGYGLVPMSLLAKVVGVATPVADSFITLCGEINGVDYWKEGLTLEKLGLVSVGSKEELLKAMENLR